MHQVSLINLKLPLTFGQSDEKIALVLALANGSAIQARQKHFGSGAAIGTKKTAGGLGAL